MTRRNHFDLSSTALHLMAMVFMLCDHLWATVLSGHDYLTDIGRLTFPIFAFLIVEGYFHTHDLKKYVRRLLLFALLSEVPFDMMMSRTVFYPLHQNVLWTFLLGIFLIWLNERVREKALWQRLAMAAFTVLLAYPLGIITFVDYYSAGLLSVLAFYFFRGRRWWCFLGQFAALWYINIELLGGLVYEWELFGQPFPIVQQGFALLALIPIWLYRGRQGYHSKWLQYSCYAFYPAHLLVLGLIQLF